MSINPEDFIPPAPHRRTLANGLVVLFRPDRAAGLVSAQVWVKTGSIHEGDFSGSGVSHFLEHMVFKGGEKYGCREIARLVQRAGGNMNAYTSFDRTVYHVDGPAESLEVALDVLAELTLGAKIDPDETERERAVILREIAMRDDDQDSLLVEGVFAETFRAHPYRFPVIGNKDIFEKITRDELAAYYHSRYAPDNMAIIVAGEAEPEAVFALAEKYFGAKPARSVAPVFVPSEPPQLAARTATVRAPARVLRGSLSWRTPGFTHPDSAALETLAHILGGGDSSRLHRKLHTESGLVHQIDASLWNPGEPGLFWISYTADLGRRAEIEAAVRAEIVALIAEGVTPARLAKARRRAIVDLVDARKTVSGQAARLGEEWCVIGDFGYARKRLALLAALTPEAVVDAARRHLVAENSTCVALEPEEDAAAGKVSEKQTLRENFSEHTLPNGVRVLLQPTPDFPKIHYRAVATGGCLHEETGERGASALLATLLCRDTEKRDADSVAEAVEGAGGALLDIAGGNTLGLAVEALAVDRHLAEELFADAVLRPAFAKKTVKLERDAHIASIRETDDDVVSWARNAARLAFFGDHPAAVDHLGRAEDLASATPESLRALWRRLLAPGNLVVAVSGAFDPDEMLASLAEKFGALSGPSPERPAAPFTGPAKTGRVVECRECEQAIIHLAYPDTGLVSEDRIAGEVLHELMSGMASRLFLSVREERGMAYFVSAMRTGFPDYGMFALYAGTEPAKAEDVLREMRLEVARVRDGGFDDGEIEAAKVRMTSGRRMGRQTIGSRANGAALNAILGLPVNGDSLWESRLAAITADDLSAFARKYLRDEASLEHLTLPSVGG